MIYNSQDYVPGPEHLPSPDYVPGLEHPPSPDYMPGPEEREADDDDDDQDDDEEEDEEEEEHLALADSTALPVVDPVSSAEDTEAFETDESAPTPPRSPRLCRAVISVRLSPPMAASMEACIDEFEVRESSSAAAARQARHTLAHRFDYGFIDTMDASIHASKSRVMTTVGEKMPPKKRTTITTTTAPMTDGVIKALIAQGVAYALAEIKANKTSRNESDEVEKYVGRLPDMIQESVMAFKPNTMHDVIEFAIKLMDQKIHSLIDRQAENKRKLDDTSRNNQNQQQPFKRHNVARTYTAGRRKRNCMADLNLCSLNATTITMGSVLPSAPTAREMAIWPRTIEASLLLPTTKEPQRQIKGFSLALSVELRPLQEGFPKVKEQESWKSRWEW
nr:hypothetical protein [Tanacetum cinerariifolium]